jgi:hypothetical protein
MSVSYFDVPDVGEVFRGKTEHQGIFARAPIAASVATRGDVSSLRLHLLRGHYGGPGNLGSAGRISESVYDTDIAAYRGFRLDGIFAEGNEKVSNMPNTRYGLDDIVRRNIANTAAYAACLGLIDTAEATQLAVGANLGHALTTPDSLYTRVNNRLVLVHGKSVRKVALPEVFASADPSAGTFPQIRPRVLPLADFLAG